MHIKGKLDSPEYPCRGAHDSILNACWQTYLFVETWLLFSTGDSWSALRNLSDSHVQLRRGYLLSF